MTYGVYNNLSFSQRRTNYLLSRFLIFEQMQLTWYKHIYYCCAPSSSVLLSPLKNSPAALHFLSLAQLLRCFSSCILSSHSIVTSSHSQVLLHSLHKTLPWLPRVKLRNYVQLCKINGIFLATEITLNSILQLGNQALLNNEPRSPKAGYEIRRACDQTNPISGQW